MKTIKYTEAKTEKLQRAITMLSLYKNKATLGMIKDAAKFSGLELKGRTFKAIYPQLVEFYELAMLEEEAETLVITYA